MRYSKWLPVNMVWNHSTQQYEDAEEKAFERDKYDELVNELTSNIVKFDTPSEDDYQHYYEWRLKHKRRHVMMNSHHTEFNFIQELLKLAKLENNQFAINCLQYESYNHEQTKIIAESEAVKQYYIAAHQRYENIKNEMMSRTFYHSKFRVPGAIIKVIDEQLIEKTLILGDVDICGNIGTWVDDNEYDDYPGNRWTVIAVKIPLRNFISKIRKS